MTFRERLQQGLMLFDGAMGTQVHDLNPTDEEWDHRQGCPEVLNLTIPEKIQRIHENYLQAGSDAVETNTFGGSELVLFEFDLQDRVEEINKTAAEIARRAVENHSHTKPRFVVGSMGPGTKLITLGQTDFDTLYKSYYRQAYGLLQGGVDAFIIETCQDLLQVKCVLAATKDAMNKLDVDVPRIVSVTIETIGTMLVGSELGAAFATLAPFDIEVLGINCATGPEHMRPFVKQICDHFNGPVIVQPNAGMPENIDGELVYTLPIKTFAGTLTEFISEFGVNIVGGCCGTNPDYIKALYQKISSVQPAERHPLQKPSLASLFSEQAMEQEPRPFYVGERSNTNGSKKFRELLLMEDWDGIVDVCKQQQLTGAHGLDVCVAYTGRDEARDMYETVHRVVKQVDLPIFIDSTDEHVTETALKLIGGRPVINSVNLEDGEQRAHRICQLAKRYGAALIALTIDEQGMAKSAERKLQIAQRIYDIAVNQHGLRPQDLIFDALTFTLGSGDEEIKKAGINTLEGIRQIKKTLPGVYTILGVSNVSFGLKAHSRDILNSVFMNEALKAGLDMAIVNVKKILPLHTIDKEDIEFCLDLIYDRGKDPLFTFIDHFDHKEGTTKNKQTEDEDAPVGERIKQRVINGNRSNLDALLYQAMDEGVPPVDIINEILIPAMKVVGNLFGQGKMQLPFVLQSAEVMKYAVSQLEPHLDKKDTREQKSIVLATVRGDVHDIGKNLVDIILSNNGYKVYNLGIKCEIDTILQKANQVNADAIGMSGLLVKSTVVMKENLNIMKQRSIDLPVLLGGAALTESYVREQCNPVLDSPVVYCADAFAGLKAMSLLKEGKIEDILSSSSEKRTTTKTAAPAGDVEPVSRKVNIPEPPFRGSKVVRDIDVDNVYDYLTESVIFRGRWGYRRGNLSREEYHALIEKEVRPKFEELKKQAREEKLFDPQVVYGYYPCNSQNEDVIIFHPDTDEEMLRFHFPRQQKPPYRCIADFFLPVESEQHDVIVVQVVTVGPKASQWAQQLYAQDQYKDYLLFHGFSVEAAEALAEYWHWRVRQELGIAGQDGTGMEDFIVQKYHGSRYSFGYPSCPDLAENRKIFQLLKPEQIGVTLSEEDQMQPEQTTSAFIVHHPQAKYFNIK